MELTRIVVKNFKRVESVPIDLAGVNILVGANGSGKSSIIQAVHLACCLIRQAKRVDPSKTATVGIDDLDYLPTDDYKTLGYRSNWGNSAGSPCSEVSLVFAKPDNSIVSASCSLRSARNAGISITGDVPTELSSLLRAKRRFFSAYIPGISGIPNKEERKSKKVILKACSYGDSNVILRNALLLLKESDANHLSSIERWIGLIAGPIRLYVSHENESDLYINCSIEIGGVARLLELAGTGYIQLIQIFSYILLFNPGILLIDEPDIHLHPHVQERLVGVLADVAREKSMKILMTTHSPFVVRGASIESSVCWLSGGHVETSDRTMVDLALGWGAFAKKIILITEDSQSSSLLRLLVSQWPEIERQIAFHPGSGWKLLPTPQQAGELAKTLGHKFAILIHRDRDSLTGCEMLQLSQSYQDQGVSAWFTSGSDVESYYCLTEFVAAMAGADIAMANSYLAGINSRFQAQIREQFNAQRKTHNEELYPAGGSPTNDSVWTLFQSRHLKGAKGKFVFNQLKNVIPGNAYRESSFKSILRNIELAADLKNVLSGLLKS
jgi:energy-coupling factor transporter ATP-binding protein EcfA2